MMSLGLGPGVLLERHSAFLCINNSPCFNRALPAVKLAIPLSARAMFVLASATTLSLSLFYFDAWPSFYPSLMYISLLSLSISSSMGRLSVELPRRSAPLSLVGFLSAVDSLQTCNGPFFYWSDRLYFQTNDVVKKERIISAKTDDIWRKTEKDKSHRKPDGGRVR